MRLPQPSAALAGFDHHLRGRSIVAAVLLCLLGGTAHGAPAQTPLARAKRPPRSERPNVPRTADKRPPTEPVPPAFSDESFNECHKVPRGKRQVRVTVPASTDVNHLITWISSVTCKAFVYAVDTTAHDRNVSIVAPTYVTPEEAFRLVLNALDSVGLTLQPSKNFFQVIESQRAHVTSIPVYDYRGNRVDEE
jgi:hypothetical protein